MYRLRFVAKRWGTAVANAWWDAFLAIWYQLADDRDPDVQRDARAQSRDWLDADVLDRGGFAGGFSDGGGGEF